MNQPIPDSLLDATAQFLQKHPPFDAMEPAVLRFAAGRLRLSYHPKDSVILAPEWGEPASLYIVERGTVGALRASGWQPDDGERLTLRPGESFSVGALLERRAVTHLYSAAEDTFCYQLAAADFHELLQRSPHFHAFCTRFVTSLLQQSRRQLQMQYSGITSEQQTMNTSLRTLIKRPPLSCGPDTPVAQVLQAMQTHKVGSMIIVSEAAAPIGIFSRSDVLERVALARLDLDQPIGRVMTPDPVTLPAEATVHEAAFTMARRGCRHVPVVDESRLIGVVTERDLFALQRISMRRINRSIADASALAELQQAANDIRTLGGNMLGQGVSAEQLTLIISALNDALTQRVIELEAQRHDLGGIEWSWLAFGSEGRFEQTLSTDQDNGLLFASKAAAEDTARGRLLPFARGVNEALDACGFPLCRGNIMAANPKLCLSLSEWEAEFGRWVRAPEPQALLNACIFFDFRPIAGAARLGARLRDKLLEMTRGNSRFLRTMAQNALQATPPLGVVRDFVVDEAGDYPHTIDLKQGGARLFVDAARIFGLAQGIANTSTAQRLRHAGGRMGLGTDEIAAAVEGFFFIQQQRLRHQYAQRPLDRAGANRIDPSRLNEIDRRMLKEALRQARRLQSRLELDYQL